MPPAAPKKRLLGLGGGGHKAKLPTWCEADTTIRYVELHCTAGLSLYATLMQSMDPIVQVSPLSPLSPLSPSDPLWQSSQLGTSDWNLYKNLYIK